MQQLASAVGLSREGGSTSTDVNIDCEVTEPNPLLEDPADDRPTVSDWLSRKLQREFEESIKEQAEQHDLPVGVVADLALAAALRLSGQERIRDNMGRFEK